MRCHSDGDLGNPVNSSDSSTSAQSTISPIVPIDPLNQSTNPEDESNNSIDALDCDQFRPVRRTISVKMAPKSSRKERMRNALKLWRLRKRWEKEYDKNKALPGPFVPVHVKDKRGSMQASLILMFALMQCICGFVFPICDAFALTDTRTLFAINHKYYLELFLLSQYVGAILLLAYLQTLIWYYSESNKETEKSNHADKQSTIKEEEAFNPLERTNEDTAFEQSVEPNSNGESDRSPPTVERQWFSFSSSDPRMSNVSIRCLTETTTEGKSLIWHDEGMNLYLRLGAVGFGLGVMIHDGFNLSSAWELDEPSCHSKIWIPKHVLRLIWVLWQTYFVFKYHRLGLNAHKLFVRLAFTHLAAVNLCHWLKAVISEISETLKRADATMVVDSTHDMGISSNWTSAKNTSGIHAFAKSDHRSVNLCEGHLGETVKPYLYPLAIEYSLITGTLFYKLLQRVGDKLLDRTPSFPNGNSLLTTKLTDDSCSNMNLTFAPSVISFGDLATPTTFSSQKLLTTCQSTDDTTAVTTKCQKHTSYRQLLGCRIYLPPESETKDAVRGNAVKENQNLNTSMGARKPISFKSDRMQHLSESYCHKSHTGLFLGLMLFLACTIGMIFIASRSRNTFSKLTPHIYQYSKIFMLSVSMLACFLALIQTYSMKFRRIKAGENFEYNLLGIGLIGCLTYHMLLFVPSLETVVHAMLYRSTVEQSELIPKAQSMRDSENPISIEKLNSTAMLYLIKCTLEVCQALLQFFFIVEASRRGPCCRNQALIKPGRSAIVFLLINNLALWLMNTFEFRESEYQLTLHRQYYGIRTWSIIICCFIPLIIFFRFHSTVCLAQIWSRLYKLR